jgi:hypothetical protein
MERQPATSKLRWNSRSQVVAIDRNNFRFAYKTESDDGNPSYALWTWEIVPDEHSAQITVKWDCYPKTIGRRLLASRLRERQLRREVATSLAAIGAALGPL